MSKPSTQPLAILGGISAAQFLAEYWQKKPLLVRNALPEIVGMFEPDDIKELALDEDVTARLITQHGQNHEQWQVKNAPLSPKDFKKLPPYWTLLVQAVDHYSLELAELWKQFSFIPQWRRDDIMVSYAPQGGSVGQHFDFYDVFLLQGFGHRRWQLGQWCDESTEILPNQPLKLLAEMQVDFDEVLAPGDLLYVPPRLSHYGVAQDECLTFSFGFRMPNQAQLIDRVSDQFADQILTKTPINDDQRSMPQAIGEISQLELDRLKQQLLQAIENNAGFESAVMALISEAKYAEHIPEPEEIDNEALQSYADDGYGIALEPANRLLYRTLANDDTHTTPETRLEFWANGELFPVDTDSASLFKALADGEQFLLNELPKQTANLETTLELIVEALNSGILMLIEPDESE
ncbi:50S ribosomal protein L16 3-hydroxylase [Acinetobacter marinus]|uniref:50S ribosomal protein L16 3-hydroxylase n=1 Tax=Acinetobacter marinus TaxID=281375 RepID=A0A1G6J6C1_9GAMM|nr:cupin domain-containing protein [Acinetobacter marinus]SDC14217.1 50S ribosomal protein L16 3-hydroxylase [Acinetobacter marinus]